MTIVADARRAFQHLFGPAVADAAAQSGVIQRQREFTATTLAQTFVLGMLKNPRASDQGLARTAAVCGTAVSPQAVEQRYSPRLAAFLEALFRAAVRVVVHADRAVAPLVERFTAVTVLDSSTVRLPDGQAERFPGCGSRCGQGAAALKLQTELDLGRGALLHVNIESGRSSDNTSARQMARRAPGTLRIADRGYFRLAVFAAMIGHGEYFLSRLLFGTGVFGPDGAVADLPTWLARQARPFVDVAVELAASGYRAGLIAWRVPAEQANRRRRKLRAELRRKKGRSPTAARLAWCDWTILVTNVPKALLTPAEALVLYRARWQIELLFKRWKSQGLIAALGDTTEVRALVRLWARLLAVVVQHWLVSATAGGDPRVSWDKAYEAVRDFAGRLPRASAHAAEFAAVLTELAQVILKTCRLNKRRRAGTNELLNGWKPLDFRLT